MMRAHQVAAILTLTGIGLSPLAAGAAPQQGSAPPPIRLTLHDALERARQNSAPFQAALTDSAFAREDHVQARDALFPKVEYLNQYLYTEGNGTASARFIANNGVHEYINQGHVNEVLGLGLLADYRRTAATAAVARARAEIASRGLVVTVVQNFYAVAAAQQKLEAAQAARDEGQNFLRITQDLERGGEVAHSDVIKADLQVQERQRQLLEAQLALHSARLELAVLLFPDFNDNFEIADDLHAGAPLPALEEIQRQAAQRNPDLKAALEAVHGAEQEVTVARAGYLPSLSLDYFYGIDANRFATRVDGFKTLGYSASATLNIPVWNWGATQSRVRQAELRRTQAKRELSLAQRKLLAQIQELHAEAETSLNELALLDRSAQLAADSLRLTTMRYRSGEATVLEVVDAQNTLAQARSAYHDGAARYRVALANLQTLTGVLTIP